MISVLSVVYCGGGEISPTVKPNSRSKLESQPMFPFSLRVMWKEFLFGKIKKEEFARRIFKKKSVFLPLKLLNRHFSNMTFFL